LAHDRLGIQRHLQHVGRFDQLRGAMPRNEVAMRVLRVARADVSERIDDALVGEDAVGDGDLVTQFGELIRHGGCSLFCVVVMPAQAGIQ
jgi:hypothetical protein